VKVCGLTRIEDVHAAVRAGVDAIGLVFYPRSPRAVSLEQARRLREIVPAMVDVAVLFVNAEAQDVRQVIDIVQPDLLQFHGDETPQYCESFSHRYMRAFRVGGPGLGTAAQVLANCRDYQSASAWLVDSYSAGYGGSGLAFDLSLLHEVNTSPESRPLILAGGLNADTVAGAIEAVHPYAVDVGSGVETEPGIKSPQKIAAFVRAVQAANSDDQEPRRRAI
jgi:phosphoribosylanthranilate isomerase